MKRIGRVGFTLFVIMVFVACKKEYNVPTGGNLIGYAYLYNDYRNREQKNSGIIVSVDGTSISTTTGEDGRWEISNLNLGTYTFVMSKENYGTVKIVGKQYVGGGQTFFGTTNLYPFPKFNITSINDSTTYSIYQTEDNGTIVIYGTFSQTVPLNYAYFRLFVGTKPDVSSDPSKNVCTLIGDVLGNIELYYTSFFLFLNTRTLNNYGIVTGDTIYLVVYPDSYNSSPYIDLNTGRYYYPNLGATHSQILKEVVP